jgi:pimeloyl-ACP methyl ester carboxylesterase
MFSIATHGFRYLELFLSWLFKYPSRCYALTQGTNPLIFYHESESLYEFANSYRKDDAAKGIICNVTGEVEDFEATCKLLKTVYEEIKDLRCLKLVTAELLSKVLAYRQLKEGQIVPIPGVDSKGNLLLGLYQVDRVFDLWSKMNAFGLICLDEEKQPPLLLFRGTDFSLWTEEGRASLISDLDPLGPGRTTFEAAQNKLQEWLKERAEEEKHATVMGHSLGGIFAAYTLIKEHKYINKSPAYPSYAFNSPGVSEELLEEWKKIPAKDRPPLKWIVSRGDLVSKLGHLFGEVYESSLNRSLTPMHAHESLIFAHPFSYLQEVDVEKENGSSSRGFYSKVHKHTSAFIYQLGLKFLFPRA